MELRDGPCAVFVEEFEKPVPILRAAKAERREGRFVDAVFHTVWSLSEAGYQGILANRFAFVNFPRVLP
jgi:hypothetical protein